MQPARILIGTSGWVYPNWVGRIYPPGVTGTKRLDWYATKFPTVELNATFYRLPSINAVARWRDDVPDGFVFAVKGSRAVTHLKKLAGAEEALDQFIERILPMAPRIGCLLWQLPPRFSKDTARLDAFAARLPAGLRHAFEFRDASWDAPDVRAVLEKRNHALVWVSMRGMPEFAHATADFVYVRLHGLGDGYVWDYPDAELDKWAARLRDAGRDALVYFNNTDGPGHAVDNAATLRDMLGALAPDWPRP